MKKLILICLPVVLLISSCKKERNEFSNTIHIELPAKAVDIKEISETGNKYFSSMEYIQLELKENITLGKIDKILITDDRIYILDIFKYGGVIIYDRQGRIVNAINKTGMGPDEYNYVFGIFYDSQDHSLNLLCRHPNKIMKFDKDGNFLLKQVKLPVVLMDLKKSKNGYYAGYAGSSSINNPHSISIFSAEFKLLASEFPNHKEWQMYKIDNTLSSYNGEIYFAPMYGYTIYTVMKKSINPYIRYDFGKYNIPEKIFNDHEQYNGFERNKYIDCIDLFQETNKYLIASYIYQGAQIISFSSKINNTHETYLALNNPISKLGFGNILTMDENHLVTSLEATTVSGILESPEIRASVPEGVDMLKNAMKNPVNEFDDPILCIYHMRQ